jgi:hypothetical protein
MNHSLTRSRSPVGSILWTAVGFACRAAYGYLRSRLSGQSFDIFAPVVIDTARYATEARQAGVYDGGASLGETIAEDEHPVEAGGDDRK